MSPDIGLIGLATELARSVVTLVVLKWVSPQQSGITPGELRAELAHHGFCPTPPEVSASLLTVIAVFTIVGSVLFFVGLFLGLCLAGPVARFVANNRATFDNQQILAPRLGVRGIGA